MSFEFFEHVYEVLDAAEAGADDDYFFGHSVAEREDVGASLRLECLLVYYCVPILLCRGVVVNIYRERVTNRQRS